MEKFSLDDINSQTAHLVALKRPAALAVLRKLGCSELICKSSNGKRIRFAAVIGARTLRLCDVSDDEEAVGELGFDRQCDTDELCFVFDWPEVFDSTGVKL